MKRKVGTRLSTKSAARYRHSRRVTAQEPISAWRVWKIDRDDTGLCLRSAVIDQRWPKLDWLRATCQRDQIPDKKCTHHLASEIPQFGSECGIYGYPTPEAARETAFPVQYRLGVLIGQVALTGRVIDHETGFRAGAAYPQRIVAAECEEGCLISLNRASLVDRDPSVNRELKSDSVFSIVCPRHLLGRKAADFDWVGLLLGQYQVQGGLLSDYLLY